LGLGRRLGEDFLLELRELALGLRSGHVARLDLLDEFLLALLERLGVGFDAEGDTHPVLRARLCGGVLGAATPGDRCGHPDACGLEKSTAAVFVHTNVGGQPQISLVESDDCPIPLRPHLRRTTHRRQHQ
jgi:hypothetical protein